MRSLYVNQTLSEYHYNQIILEKQMEFFLILRAFAPFFPRGTTYRPHMILCLLHLEKKIKKFFQKIFRTKCSTLGLT